MQEMIKEYNDDSLNRLVQSYKDKDIDSYIINELLIFEVNNSNLNEESKYSVFSNLMKAFSSDQIDGINQDLQKSIFYAEKAKNIIENLPIINALHADFSFELAHVYALMGDIESSETSFNEHIYFNMKNSSYPLVVGNNNYKPKISEISDMPLYSFRSIQNYSISDLINHEITLADPALFNDPFDTPLFSKLEQSKTEEKSDYFNIPLFNAYKHIKVRCFVKDKIEESTMAFQNLLMWSHYADSHKGICIRYKFNHKRNEEDNEKRIFSNWYVVNYEDNIDFESPKYQKIKSLFATKNKCWDYENEVRLIHFDPECRNEFKQISLKEMDSKVEAVFFGCKCPENDKKIIKEIFKNQNDVEFFEFNNNPKGLWSEIYKLKPEDEIRFQKLSSLKKASYRN